MKTDLYYSDDAVILRSPSHFTLSVLFECGQCFRFYPLNPEKTRYGGIAHGKYVEIEERADSVILHNITNADFDTVFRDYFDLDFDYDACISSFPKDEYLCRAVRSCDGIRILHQEPFEALCSFILSQNNNIPRIRSLIESLCRAYGKPLSHGGKTYYAFPDAETLAGVSEAELRELKVGFRAAYLCDAAQKVANGEISFAHIDEISTEEGIAELCKIKGVGLKVASCVLLFAFRKYDSFPVDVWMKRILAEHYPPETGRDYFGKYAGIAQQYLFHYERNTAKTPNTAERNSVS